jgi:hypothetical protein
LNDPRASHASTRLCRLYDSRFLYSSLPHSHSFPLYPISNPSTLHSFTPSILHASRFLFFRLQSPTISYLALGIACSSHDPLIPLIPLILAIPRHPPNLILILSRSYISFYTLCRSARPCSHQHASLSLGHQYETDNNRMLNNQAKQAPLDQTGRPKLDLSVCPQMTVTIVDLDPVCPNAETSNVENFTSTYV